MKPERIEQHLRDAPPDEPVYTGRLDLDADAERRRPGRFGRGVLLATAAVTAVAALAIGLLLGQLAPARVGGPTGSPEPSGSPGATPAPEPSWPLGVIPWIDASPSPSPAPPSTPTPDPAAYPACAASDLAMVGGGWGGLTGGQLSGGAYVVNISIAPCRVSGVASVVLLDVSGTQIAAPYAGQSSAAPTPIALPPAGVASVGFAWSNWCGAKAALPLQLRLTLPDDGGTLTGPVRAIGQNQPPGGTATQFPGCLDASTGSSISAVSAFTPAQSSAAPASHACVAGQLAAFSGRTGPAAGTEWTTLFVLNVPGFTCTLPASPTLELRDADGKLLVTAQPSPPANATLTLPSATAASTVVGLSDWCTATPKLPLALDLVIGGTRVPVVISEPLYDPGCNSPGETHPPYFGYGGALALPTTPPPPPPNPGDILPVSVTISAPPAVVRGRTLYYTVTLTNQEPAGKPDHLEAMCPSYTEQLVLADNRVIEATYALNCAAAGTLEPGASITFGMELPVPADAQPGLAALVWHLGEVGAGAKAQFNVAVLEP
jgi:Domain of unknown function (DUF4232)